MKNLFCLKSVLVIFLACLCFTETETGNAKEVDIPTGTVIEAKNWQKAEGLVFDSVLQLIKKGDLIIHVGDLNYDPKQNLHVSVMKARDNKMLNGRFGISEKGELIDLKTGKYPAFFPGGFPFPEVKPDDPHFGIKAAYNMDASRIVTEHHRFRSQIVWVGEKGFERQITMLYLAYGPYSEADHIPNPENFTRQSIFTIIEPFDLQGTSIMTWQRNGNTLDSNFAYVPAIRRVRRTSPASRSDALFGSDLTTDDFAVFNGKMESMEWQYVETRDMLIPFLGEDPLPVTPRPDGSFELAKSGFEGAKFGYEVDGWTHAPWAPVNWNWVKRTVYVLKMTPKDPYYNYGDCLLLMDADTFMFCMKEIYDRSGKLWKIFVGGNVGLTSSDGKFKFMDNQAGGFVYDIKRNHASVGAGFSPKYDYIWHAKTDTVDPNDFTMAGFMKYCK